MKPPWPVVKAQISKKLTKSCRHNTLLLKRNRWGLQLRGGQTKKVLQTCPVESRANIKSCLHVSYESQQVSQRKKVNFVCKNEHNIMSVSRFDMCFRDFKENTTLNPKIKTALNPSSSSSSDCLRPDDFHRLVHRWLQPKPVLLKNQLHRCIKSVEGAKTNVMETVTRGTTSSLWLN